MKSFLCFLLMCLAMYRCQAERKRYDGYQMYEVNIKSRAQATLLEELQEELLLDLSGSIHRSGGQVQYIVAPGHAARVAMALFSKGMAPFLLEKDMQSVIDAEWASISRRYNDAGQLDYDPDDFNDLEACSDQAKRLADLCRPGFECTYESIGPSYEERPIEVFTISKSGSVDAPIILLDATVHAREWLTTSTTMRMIDMLVTSDDSTVTALLDQYDFHIIPVMNPDGYKHSWDSDRFWRKSRNVNPTSTCRGVDLNRNYDVQWGKEGVSHSACSDIFCGAEPASEPETKAAQEYGLKFMTGGISRIQAWVTFHTYGWMWMFPWGHTVDHAGWTCVRSDDYDDLMQVAEAAADAIEDDPAQSRPWARGTSCEVIYATTGATDDWAKAKAGVKYAYNPELRGPGFNPDRSNIEPAFQETWAGVVAMIKEIEIVEGRH